MHSRPYHGLVSRCSRSAWLLAPLSRTASSSAQSAKVRRILRSKRDSSVPDHAKLCVAASRADAYDLSGIVGELKKRGIEYSLNKDAKCVSGVINNSLVIFLANGSLVAWDTSESQVLLEIIPAFKAFESHSYKTSETEDMDYVEETTSDQDNAPSSGMLGDVIYIQGPSEQDRLCDKIAFSIGLARHTALSALETSVEQLIVQVRGISSNMADGTDPGLGHKDVHQITGRLLQTRGVLNLYSEITETPDFYWSEPELEQLYELVSKRLDVEPRIRLLNRKLDYVSDMASELKSHLSEQTSNRLEWIIIILISVEVAFEMRHFI